MLHFNQDLPIFNPFIIGQKQNQKNYKNILHNMLKSHIQYYVSLL
jgi:hypothetical protein